jgi:hypothetical protein
LQDYEGHITVIPRVGPKDFLRILNNPNPTNTSEWFLRGRIMTYFKIEEIKASLFFENVLKEIICQLDHNEKESKELFENSIYNDIYKPQQNMIFKSAEKKKIKKTNSHRFIKKNFSEENIIESMETIPLRKSLFNNSSNLQLGKPVFEEEFRSMEPWGQKSIITRPQVTSSKGFYESIVQNTQQLYTQKKESESLKRLLEKFV